MPSYKERAELIKALSEDQYFKARLKTDESESVRIGDRDGRTGRYQILHQDGGITSNGIKTFNQAAPQDGFVRALGKGNGGVALDHRNRKQEQRRKVNQEEPLLITPIKFIQGSRSITLDQIYIGGDRPDPELIFTQPDQYITTDAYLTTLGTGQDEWLLQTISTKKTIIDRFSANKTIIDIYLEDPTLFNDGQILQTITPNSSISFYSSGNLLADGTIYTGQMFLVSFVLSEIQSGVPTELGLISVEDTYDAISSGVWTYNRTARSVNFNVINGALDPSVFDTVRLNAQSILTAKSSNAISWRSLSDAGLSNPFSGYSVRVGSSLQNPSIRGGYFSQDAFKLNQLRSILFGIFASPNNSFKMRNGWFFNKDGIFSKTASKWLGAYTSFNTPTSTGFLIPWSQLNFTSNTATQSIGLPISTSRTAIITASTASIQYAQPDFNINNNAPPTPNDGEYKPLDLIQGWNQETQLVKAGSDWRLYLSDGSFTVVKIPTYKGISFLSLSSSATPDILSLVGDALFAALSFNTDTQQLALVGAQLKTTPQDITEAKVVTVYLPNNALGQVKNIDIYLTMDDYDALEAFIG